MERYFIVTEQSSLHKEWFNFKNNENEVRAFVKRFMDENEIGANEYYASDDALYIVPKENDSEKFNNVLGATLENGLRKFKATSKIGKKWISALEEAGLKILRKPMVILYFKSFGGKFRSRLFDQDGILYCSIEPTKDETPEGMIEIKASEFFKVIEDSEKVSA